MNKTIINAELNSITPLLDGLKAVEQEKNSLQFQFDKHIINSVDASIDLEKVRKKEIQIKKQLVDKVHTKSNGKPLSITKYEATSSYPNGYWYTRAKGGAQIKAKTLDELYCKLYDTYYGNDILTVGKVFNLALEEKKITQNPDAKTLIKNGNDYKRFISTNLGQKPITEVTERDIGLFLEAFVTSAERTDRQLTDCKGILNIIFRYAVRERLIDRNPVDAIDNRNYKKSCVSSKKPTEQRIFSEEEISMLQKEIRRRMTLKKYGDYYVSGYAMLIAIETGMRSGELCGLQWADIDFSRGYIHIHRQELQRYVNGKFEYYHVDKTKNEKGVSQGGRYFPLTSTLSTLFLEIQDKQNKYNIQSAFVCARKDGTALKTKTYQSFVHRICDSLGLKATCNHTFRRSLSSNVMMQNGINEADRGKLLGHSAETNLKYYTYENRDYIEKARIILENNQKCSLSDSKEHFQTIIFPKRKSLQSANCKAFPNKLFMRRKGLEPSRPCGH